MALRMRTVMTAPWAGVTCHLALSLFSYNIVDFEISTQIFDLEPNRSHHNPLCVGYLASFTSKYIEGSSDGAYGL